MCENWFDIKQPAFLPSSVVWFEYIFWKFNIKTVIYGGKKWPSIAVHICRQCRKIWWVYIKYRVLSVRSCRWMCRISTSFASLQVKQFLIPGKTMHIIYEYTRFFLVMIYSLGKSLCNPSKHFFLIRTLLLYYRYKWCIESKTEYF